MFSDLSTTTGSSSNSIRVGTTGVLVCSGETSGLGIGDLVFLIETEGWVRTVILLK